jgi:hypothetical protein
MGKVNIENLTRILNQYDWPIHLSYQTKAISNITEVLVDIHRKKINDFQNYNISDLFSLYYVVEYAIKDLWESEFNTVTWLDLYEEGYPILNSIQKSIIQFSEK